VWLCGGSEKSDLYSAYHNYECLVKAKYFFATEKYNEAIAILDLPENRKSLGHFLLWHIQMECLKAASLFRIGDKESALAVLENAYNTAAPNDVVMPFIELGSDISSLAAQALNEPSAEIPRPWLENILRLSSAYGKNISVIAGQLQNRAEISGIVYLTHR
jgi:hypothetical protein